MGDNYTVTDADRARVRARRAAKPNHRKVKIGHWSKIRNWGRVKIDLMGDGEVMFTFERDSPEKPSK